MEEAVSGVKGELAVKIFGGDLKDLEKKGERDRRGDETRPGRRRSRVFRVLGQPNVNLIVDRAKADRFGINVADVQDAIQTAVGGNPVSQILMGEQRFDLVVRYQEPFRSTIDDIANIRILAPSGERVSLGAALRHQSRRRRIDDLPRRQPALHRHQVQRARPRPGQHGRGGHGEGESQGEAAGRLPPGLGRRIRKPEARQSAAGRDHSADAAVILLILYSMFRSLQMGVCWSCST